MKRIQEMSIEGVALRRLRQLTTPLDRPGKILRFPAVFGRICPLLCLTKKDAWRVLKQLELRGAIEIVPYQGVRLPGIRPV